MRTTDGKKRIDADLWAEVEKCFLNNAAYRTADGKDARISDPRSPWLRGSYIAAEWLVVARDAVNLTRREAIAQAPEGETPTIVWCQAIDTCDRRTIGQTEAYDLLQKANLNKFGGAAFVGLVKGGVYRLTQKENAKQGLVQDCRGVLLDVIYHKDDEVRIETEMQKPPNGKRIHEILCEHMPKGIILQIYEDDECTQMSTKKFHPDLGPGQVCISPMTHPHEQGGIKRTQLPITIAGSYTANSIQGKTTEYTTVFVGRPAHFAKKKGVKQSQEDATFNDYQWWCCLYVMISRTKQLSNLLLIGATPEEIKEMVEMGPPHHLAKEYERLYKLAAATREKCDELRETYSYKDHINPETKEKDPIEWPKFTQDYDSPWNPGESSVANRLANPPWRPADTEADAGTEDDALNTGTCKYEPDGSSCRRAAVGRTLRDAHTVMGHPVDAGTMRQLRSYCAQCVCTAAENPDYRLVGLQCGRKPRKCKSQEENPAAVTTVGEIRVTCDDYLDATPDYVLHEQLGCCIHCIKNAIKEKGYSAEIEQLKSTRDSDVRNRSEAQRICTNPQCAADSECLPDLQNNMHLAAANEAVRSVEAVQAALGEDKDTIKESVISSAIAEQRCLACVMKRLQLKRTKARLPATDDAVAEVRQRTSQKRNTEHSEHSEARKAQRKTHVALAEGAEKRKSVDNESAGRKAQRQRGREQPPEDELPHDMLSCVQTCCGSAGKLTSAFTRNDQSVPANGPAATEKDDERNSRKRRNRSRSRENPTIGSNSQANRTMQDAQTIIASQPSQPDAKMAAPAADKQPTGDSSHERTRRSSDAQPAVRERGDRSRSREKQTTAQASSTMPADAQTMKGTPASQPSEQAATQRTPSNKDRPKAAAKSTAAKPTKRNDGKRSTSIKEYINNRSMDEQR